MFMFNSIEQFKEEWQAESESTRKVLKMLTDESLKQGASTDHRTVGRVAWHIVQTLPEMGKGTGLSVAGPSEEEPVPDTAQAIIDAYNKAANSLMDLVTTNWTDDTLEIEDDLYGQKWKRGLTLYGIIKHEIHHRGQLTVLMRIAGLKVPGVFGPSKEEWTQYGIPAPAI